MGGSTCRWEGRTWIGRKKRIPTAKSNKADVPNWTPKGGEGLGGVKLDWVKRIKNVFNTEPKN